MSRETSKPWSRTTKGRPCPVCRRSGCLQSSVDNPDAVVCRRIASSKPVGNLGHLHEMKPSAAWAPWRRSLQQITREALHG